MVSTYLQVAAGTLIVARSTSRGSKLCRNFIGCCVGGRWTTLRCGIRKASKKGHVVESTPVPNKLTECGMAENTMAAFHEHAFPGRRFPTYISLSSGDEASEDEQIDGNAVLLHQGQWYQVVV